MWICQFFYPKIYNIVNEVKKVFDIRKINTGRPYIILSSKDSINIPQYFIYQPSSIDYVVVSLNDSLWAQKKQKEVKLIEKEASGVIKSSLAETLQELKLSPLLTNELSEIYAWNIDFFRLEKGDNFHVYRGLRHQMIALEDTELFEFSTEHMDTDSHRIMPGDLIW